MAPGSPAELAPLQDWLDRAAFVCASLGALVFGYRSGFVHVELGVVSLLSIGFIEAELSAAFFGAFIVASTLVFLAGSVGATRRSPPDPPADAGRVTAVVPVYRDAAVLGRAVDSLRRSAYEDLEILIVTEPDDDATTRRARDLAASDGVDVLVNTANPGSKAGAINAALAATEGPYVSVHDADELVAPEFLPRAVAKLQDVDVVQGRTVPEPDGIIESMAYYESVLLSYVARRVLYVFTGFKMAASRAVVARREALEAVGGYDESMLTEDFYFAYQCYRARLEVAELLDCPARIQAAHSLPDWWGQRKRWMTGYAQVFHRLLGTARPLTDYRNALSIVIAGGTVVGSLLMLTVISKFAVLLAVGSTGAFALPLAGILGATLAVRWHDRRRGLVAGLGWYWPLVPLVLPLYSLSAIKAVFEYIFSWEGEWYRVSKLQ